MPESKTWKDEKKKTGYIKVWRCIMEDPLWKSSKPFDERSAWVDCLLLTARFPYTLEVQGLSIPILTGEWYGPYRYLTRRWHWTSHGTYEYIRKLRRLEYLKEVSIEELQERIFRDSSGTLPQVFRKIGTLHRTLNFKWYQEIAKDTGRTPGGTFKHSADTNQTRTGHIKEGKEGKEKSKDGERVFASAQTDLSRTFDGTGVDALQLDKNLLVQKFGQAFPLVKSNVYGIFNDALVGQRRFSHIGPRKADELIELIESIPPEIEEPIARLIDMLEKPEKYAQ